VWGAIDRYFQVSESGSSWRVELRAAVTTFVTMAYILFVNPEILGQAIVVEGQDLFPQLLTATALAAALGSAVMGLAARYPFALAPGMGINAYFTYSVVLGQGIPWTVALGAVFLSGALFLVLSVTGVRTLVVDALPAPLKLATSAGIGLFLAIIGAQGGGLIADHPATLVTLGDLSAPKAALCLAGLTSTAILLALRVRGAILIGIVSTSALAIVFDAPVFANGEPFGGFSGGFVQAPVWPSDLFLSLDIAGAFDLGIVSIVFVFLFVDFFDTAGTLLGLSARVGFSDSQLRLQNSRAAFTADAVATSAGALLGTSSTTTYIESAAGIEDGGRTGLTAVLVALLFIVSTCLWPVAAAVPGVATAPTLIVVGAMMMSTLQKIEWVEYRETIPVFLTITMMPLTYSIANGIAFGIISYAVLHATTGRARDVHWLVYGIAGLLIARYAFMA
jgi:adenine/guanine/hypoxanthine permease